MANKIHTTQTIREYTRRLRVLFLVAVVVSLFQTSYAANITLSPSSGSYKVGATLSIDVLITQNKEPINAVSSTVSFSEETLELRSISKSSSVITLWAEEPSFSNTNGSASFEGVVLNPGFSGAQGKVVTLIFRVKKSGTGSVMITNGSVLANDGNATNVLGTLGSASFTLSEDVTIPVIVAPTIGRETSVTTSRMAEPTIISTTHPDSNKWYNSRNVTFSWDIPAGVTAVRTLYDAKPISTPTRTYDPPISSKSFLTDEDGIMYMHVQWKDEDGWGVAAHHKFQIDTVAPKRLEVTLPEGEVTTNTTPTVTVEAEDELSGLDRVSFRVDDGDEVEFLLDASNTYKLPKLQPGNHTIIASIYDKASNRSHTSFSVTVKALDAPIVTYYTKQAEYGNKITVSGTTYPGMVVEILFTDEDKNTDLQTTQADSNGNFSLIWSDSQAGVHEMSARAVDGNGTAGAWTEGRLIVIENVKLIRIGMFIMNWLSLILIIILASALVIATLWYSFLQFTRFRRKIHRTIKEAEISLKTGVQALRRDTEEFHTILVKAEKKRELTKEEQTILRKFKKRLDTTEKDIAQKLEQIG